MAGPNPNKYQYIVSLLMKETGMSYQQALGSVGSLMQESSFNLDTSTLGTADSKGSYGIAQWHSGRLAQLKDFARKKSQNWTDFYTQAQFVVHELKGSHSGALAQIKRAGNIEQASRAFTDHYEKPHKDYTHYNQRKNYAIQLHSYLKQNNLFPNFKNNTMSNISDPKNPNFEASQTMSVAEKNKIINDYVSKISAYKKSNNESAIKSLNEQMYKKGYFGFNSDGVAQGFLAESLNTSNTARSAKTKLDNNQKAILFEGGLRMVREASRGVKDQQASYGRGGVNSGNRTGYQEKNAIVLDPELSRTMYQTYRAKLTPEYQKELDKLWTGLNASSASAKHGAISRFSGEWNKWSGRKDHLIGLQKIHGRDFLVAGKSASVNYAGDNMIGFKDPQKDGFEIVNDFQRGKFKIKGADNIPVANYDPKWDGYGEQDQAIPNIDYSIDTSTQVPDVDGLNYYRPDFSSPDNSKITAEFEAQRRKGIAANEASRNEAKAKTAEEIKADEDKAAIETARSVFDLAEGVKVDETKDADPSTFKSRFPIEQLVSGITGSIIGRDMMEEDLPERDERINGALLSYLEEQKRISTMGMNPSDEAAAKQSMADAYQIGVDNLTRASNGNRNLILGNLANLDNINAKNMMALSMEDAKMKQAGMEAYGRALEYVNNFEAQRSVANNERKYQQAVQRSLSGAALFAGAFKSMTDAIGGYDSPNSAENMFKIRQEVDMFGWSPNIEDDGSGDTWGSKSWSDKKQATARDFTNRYQDLKTKLSAEGEDFQNEFFLKHKNSSIDTMMVDLENMYGQTEPEADMNTVSSNVVDESGNIIGQESKPSQATVPMNITQIQNADGSTTPATPYSAKTTDGTSANATMNPNQPNLVLPNKTFAPGFESPQPVKIGTFGTASGQTVNVNMGTDKKPENNLTLNKSLAYAMGWENNYDLAEDTQRYLDEMGSNADERFNNVQNIINKYKS